MCINHSYGLYTYHVLPWRFPSMPLYRQTVCSSSLKLKLNLLFTCSNFCSCHSGCKNWLDAHFKVIKSAEFCYKAVLMKCCLIWSVIIFCSKLWQIAKYVSVMFLLAVYVEYWADWTGFQISADMGIIEYVLIVVIKKLHVLEKKN